MHCCFCLWWQGIKHLSLVSTSILTHINFPQWGLYSKLAGNRFYSHFYQEKLFYISDCPEYNIRHKSIGRTLFKSNKKMVHCTLKWLQKAGRILCSNPWLTGLLRVLVGIIRIIIIENKCITNCSKLSGIEPNYSNAFIDL